jgi:hypothetical protein
MSNVYYEAVDGTPFGILVLRDISSGYRWFVTYGDVDVSDNEFILECNQSLNTPYEAVEDALYQLTEVSTSWRNSFALKLQQWSANK